jgi:hypothetical protein
MTVWQSLLLQALAPSKQDTKVAPCGNDLTACFLPDKQHALHTATPAACPVNTAAPKQREALAAAPTQPPWLPVARTPAPGIITVLRPPCSAAKAVANFFLATAVQHQQRS